jgi:hypothetical protein
MVTLRAALPSWPSSSVILRGGEGCLGYRPGLRRDLRMSEGGDQRLPRLHPSTAIRIPMRACFALQQAHLRRQPLNEPGQSRRLRGGLRDAFKAPVAVRSALMRLLVWLDLTC